MKKLIGTIAILSTFSVYATLDSTKCKTETEGTPSEVESSVVVFNSIVLSALQSAKPKWDHLKVVHQCEHGRMQDLTFSLNKAPGSNGVVQGSMIPGFIKGENGKTFFGANYGSKDLIVIEKNDKGTNVIVSLCMSEDRSEDFNMFGMEFNYNQGRFIGPNAGLRNFQIDYALLEENRNCSEGQILDGHMTFYSTTAMSMVPTQFTKVDFSCE